MGTTTTDIAKPPIPLGDLPSEFRRRATLSREYAASEQAACAWEGAAQAAEEALRAHAEEHLSLDQAEFDSGYTKRHLQRLAREGKTVIEPDGTILRKNLPRKPGHGLVGVAKTEPDERSSKAQLARAVANGG